MTEDLEPGASIQCRECVTACPEQAVSAGRDFEIAAYTRDQLTQLLVAMGVREARQKPDGPITSTEPVVAGGTAWGRAPILALAREAKEA